MITVQVVTTDSKVWNQKEVFAKISHAIFTNQDLTIDLLSEGPAFDTLGLAEHIHTVLALTEYSSTITVITCNMLEADHPDYRVIRNFPHHLVQHSFDYQYNVQKKQHLKHFGFFVGRSTAPRLYLSSYLYNHHPDLMIHSNHLDLEKEFYAVNLELDRLISEYGLEQLDNIAHYIKVCPISECTISMNKSAIANHAQQLLHQDHTRFLDQYNEFAIEIAAETYFSGHTFFPTEKTWRPILLRTPFIVQGPTGYLKHLKKLGFKTFSDYWDEGYDEDPYPWSVKEVVKVIDWLASKSQDTLHDMVCDMKCILDHNHQRFLDLANEPKHKTAAVFLPC